jgi:DNA-binding transcriptional ArsR family regulator
VDEKRRVLTAVRGGYKLDIGRIEACHFLPSAFNDRRYWTSFEISGGSAVVYFPYFDPSLAPEPGPPAHRAPGLRSAQPSEPELDPALVFRALGDATRYAIVSLLAREPRSSIELAKALSLSKPAVSHHIAKLREAGLLQEQPTAGTIRLSLRRDVLENLSSIVIDRLFDDDRPVELKTTRSKT